MDRSVWIPKAAGHSFSEAKEYGDIKIVLDDDISPFNIDQARAKIREIIKVADEKDYVAVSGPSVLCMIFMNEWGKRFDRIRFLLFHARTQKYILREVDLKQ